MRDERVTPGAGGRFFLARTPIIEVLSVKHVRVLNSDGTIAHEFGDGSILYGAGAARIIDHCRQGQALLVFMVYRCDDDDRHALHAQFWHMLDPCDLERQGPQGQGDNR